jgi:hypothetical protein
MILPVGSGEGAGQRVPTVGSSRANAKYAYQRDVMPQTLAERALGRQRREDPPFSMLAATTVAGQCQPAAGLGGRSARR